MKIAICQFSGTGNTYLIASFMQKQLITLGHNVDVFAIEKMRDNQFSLKAYDMLGLGYPIYGSDMPAPVSTFVDNLASTNTLRAFVFCTQLMYSGDGAAYGAKKLIKKGYQVNQLEHFNMPNNITDYLRFLLAHKYSAKRLKRKEKQAKRFALKIHNNRKKLRGMNVFSLMLGLLQRVPYQKMESSWGDNAIKIDESCILCGKCVKLCPVENFRIENNHLSTNNRCILCYRCINHCPVLALHISPKKRTRHPYKGPTSDFNIEMVKEHHLYKDIKNE